MDTDTPKATAELYAEGARKNYEAYGDLAPMVALCCEAKVVMVMAAGGTEDQPQQFAAIIIATAGRLRPHTVVTVAEGWMQHLPYDNEAEAKRKMDAIRRGDLGRMAAAGDATVGTALMTTAWRIDPRETYSILDYVVTEPPRRATGGWHIAKGRKPISSDFEYSRSEHTGDQEGHMAEMVMGGWTMALDHPAPEELEDLELYSMLGTMGLATSISVQEWDADA